MPRKWRGEKDRESDGMIALRRSGKIAMRMETNNKRSCRWPTSPLTTGKPREKQDICDICMLLTVRYIGVQIFEDYLKKSTTRHLTAGRHSPAHAGVVSPGLCITAGYMIFPAHIRHSIRYGGVVTLNVILN